MQRVSAGSGLEMRHALSATMRTPQPRRVHRPRPMKAISIQAHSGGGCPLPTTTPLQVRPSLHNHLNVTPTLSLLTLFLARVISVVRARVPGGAAGWRHGLRTWHVPLDTPPPRRTPDRRCACAALNETAGQCRYPRSGGDATRSGRADMWQSDRYAYPTPSRTVGASTQLRRLLAAPAATRIARCRRACVVHARRHTNPNLSDTTRT